MALLNRRVPYTKHAPLAEANCSSEHVSSSLKYIDGQAHSSMEPAQVSSKY
jgi:hypothetical protein